MQKIASDQTKFYSTNARLAAASTATPLSQSFLMTSRKILASRAWCCTRRAGDGCQEGSRYLRSLTSEWPVLETNLVIGPFAGNVYLPNAALTFQGNPTVNRGAGILLVAVPLFTSIFTIFDLGRYAITMQSLPMLANAGARAMMIDDCYVTPVINKVSPSCISDPLSSDAAKKAVAPFLYSGGLTPTLDAAQGATTLTVTASQPSFTMLMPIWGTAFNAPSASTSIPF